MIVSRKMIDMHADDPLEVIDKLIAQHLRALMAHAAEMQKTAKTDAATVLELSNVGEFRGRLCTIYCASRA